jgi:hypothetical protein
VHSGLIGRTPLAGNIGLLRRRVRELFGIGLTDLLRRFCFCFTAVVRQVPIEFIVLGKDFVGAVGLCTLSGSGTRRARRPFTCGPVGGISIRIESADELELALLGLLALAHRLVMKSIDGVERCGGAALDRIQGCCMLERNQGRTHHGLVDCLGAEGCHLGSERLPRLNHVRGQ